MKPMKLVLASTAAAVLAAFNPAFAGGGSEYQKDSSASAQTNSDITAGANVGAGQSSTDTSAGSEEKLTGLDRADQAAGEHGQQGRDNARENQAAGTTLGDSTAGAEPGRDAALEPERRLN